MAVAKCCNAWCPRETQAQSGPLVADQGALSCTATPASGYLLTGASGDTSLCGTVTFSGNAISGAPVTGNCTITGRFGEADDDDIPTEQEEQVPTPGGGTGDGNGDGTPDSTQNAVASIPTAEGGGYGTLVSGDPSTTTGPRLEAVAAVSPSAVDAPDDLTFPFGLFRFRVVNLSPGGSVNMTLYVTRNTEITGYYKKNQDTGEWTNIATGVDHSSVAGKTKISFTLIDGGPYDTDRVAGQITDPGGPGIDRRVPQPGPATPVPTLSSWALGLLALLIPGLAAWRRRP